MASGSGARKMAMWGTDQLQANEGRVLNELGQGQTAAQGYLGQAGDLWKDFASQGLGGLERYQALTTGSPANMNAALEGTPGYQFAMDQGLQALNRRRAAGGMLNSGNADVDAIQFGQGLASQTLGQERQALLPLMGMYQQGVQGQSGVLAGQGQLANDYHTNRASVMDNTTKSVLGLGAEAFKAGDQAKSQNQANALTAAKIVGSLVLGVMTGGAGFGLLGALGAAGAAGAAGGAGRNGFASPVQRA